MLRRQLKPASSAEYEIGFDLVQAATLAEFQLSSKLLLVKLRVLPSEKVVSNQTVRVDMDIDTGIR